MRASYGVSHHPAQAAIANYLYPTGLQVLSQFMTRRHLEVRHASPGILGDSFDLSNRRSRVYDHFERQKRAERDATRKDMIGSGDRSQRIRTYNFPQNRLTDHRINLSLYSLDKIIMGDMDELIGALIDYDKHQRLENL